MTGRIDDRTSQSDVRAPAELAEGTFVGTYRVLRTVTLGDAWQVYEAKSGTSYRQVALKIAARPLDGLREAFESRGMLLRDLEHPNLARIFDLGEESGLLYVAEEFVAGPRGDVLDLEQELLNHGGTLSEDRVRVVAGQLLSALHYLHRFRGAGLCHGDLSEQRILLNQQRRVKLSGLATADPGDPGPADPHADARAAGAILYRSLTGRELTGDCPPPSAVGAHREWDRVVNALVQASEETPADLEELREQVLTLGEQTRRRRVLMPTIAALVFVGLLVAGVFGVREYRARRDRARRQLLEQQAKEREEQVAKFLEYAQTALAKMNYAAARKAVGKVLEAVPDHARALRLQADIDAAEGLARIGPVKSEAEIGWARVRELERGQGFGVLIADLEDQMRRARNELSEMKFEDAGKRYRHILDATANLTKLDAQRLEATEARARTGVAKDAADAADAAEFADDLWKQAVTAEEDAGQNFEKRRFPEAVRRWENAREMFVRAERKADVAHRLRAAKAAYDAYYAGIGEDALGAMPDAIRVKVEGLAKDAEALADREEWIPAAETWETALGVLKQGVNEAGNVLRTEHFDEALARGRAHLAAERYGEARDALEEAVGIEGYREHAEALALLSAARKAVGAAPVTTTRVGKQGNLVLNGDFADGKNGAPLGWTPPDNLTVYWHDDPDMGKCIRMDTDVYRAEWEEHRKNPDIPMKKTPTTGTRYNTVGGTAGVAVYSRPIPVEQDAYYLVEYDIKGQGEPFVFVKGFWKCAAEDLAAQGEKIFFRPFDDGPSFSLMAMGTSGEERRAPRPGDYIQSYRRRVVARFPDDDKEGWRHFKSVIHFEPRHHVELVMLELYAFWPPGDYYFDNVSMKRVTKAYADEYEAERRKLGKTANFGTPAKARRKQD